MSFVVTMQLRIQKRQASDSNGTRAMYVQQQLFSGVDKDTGAEEWRDVPLVDEKGNEAKYE